VYAEKPYTVAKEFEAAGASFIHIVDLDGALAGHTANAEAISEIVKNVSIGTEIGGGIRTMEDIKTKLNLGLNRVIIGTKAVKEPQFIKEAIEAFGADRVVIGIDAKDGMVAIEGWETVSDRSAVAFALEMKKLGDMCEDYGVAMAIHMAESPVGCMAAIHAAAAVQNVLAVEFHSVDVPWWQSIAKGLPTPLMKDGFIDVPNKPGLGIDDLDDEVLAQHIHEKYPGLWEPTTQWDNEWANDREWS
jgi:hypothetical protein